MFLKPRVGPNHLHLYVSDPKTRAPYDRALQVTIAATLPSKDIGPLTQTGKKSGPGRYTVPSVPLAVPGRWKLQINVLISKFAERSQTIEVPVR